MGRDDLLLEILERVARVEAKLDDGLTETVKGHEKRLRALERFTWAILGVLGTLQVAAPFIWEAIKGLLGR